VRGDEVAAINALVPQIRPFVDAVHYKVFYLLTCLLKR